MTAPDPEKERRTVVLVLAAVLVFALVMGGYVTLSIAGKDTDAYFRFLTLLVTAIVPSSLGAWQAFKANRTATQANDTAHAIQADVRNGVLKDKVKEGIAEVLNGDSSSVSYLNGTLNPPEGKK